MHLAPFALRTRTVAPSTRRTCCTRAPSHCSLYSRHARRPSRLPVRRARVAESPGAASHPAAAVRRAGASRDVRRPVGRQSLVEQLSRADQPSRAQGPRHRGDRAARRRARARCARSPAPWTSTWSSSAGSPSSSRSKRWSCSRAASPPTPARSRPSSRKEDVVISDALNHASIIDGCRLSRAAIKVFPHKDVDAARAILRDLPASQRKLLITDGVFSMDGDLGPLPALCDLAEEFGCIMMVDDAHASGVFGRNGRGTSITSTCTAASTSRSARCRRRWARSAATSPAAARSSTSSTIARGRSCSRPRIRRRWRRRASRPSTCCSSSRQLIERLWENTRFFQDGLRRLGLRHRPEREPDRAGHGRRGRARDAALRPAVRRKACSRRASPSPPWRATRRASAPSSAPATRATSCSSRSTSSAESAWNWDSWPDVSVRIPIRSDRALLATRAATCANRDYAATLPATCSLFLDPCSCSSSPLHARLASASLRGRRPGRPRGRVTSSTSTRRT